MLIAPSSLNIAGDAGGPAMAEITSLPPPAASAETLLAGAAPRRRRWRSVALAALAVAAGFWLGWPSRRGVSAGQELVIAADALQLGDVWTQGDFRATLPLQNVSEQALEIVHLGCSPCGCCKFEPSTLTIPPGEQREIQVQLDLRPRNEKEAQLPERDYHVNVTVGLLGEIGPPRTWQLSGRVRSALAISPRRLDFAQTIVQGLPSPARTVTIRPHAPLADLVIECDSNQLTARLERNANAGGEYRLTVQPRPTLPEGPFEAAVLLKPVVTLARSGRTAPPPIAYQVVGEVQGDVQALPSSVSFGPQKLGATGDYVVALRSRSGQPFEVLSCQATSPDLRVAPMAAEAAVSASHQFRFQPTFARSGRFAAEVDFSVRLANQTAKVVVPVWAHVAEPD